MEVRDAIAGDLPRIFDIYDLTISTHTTTVYTSPVSAEIYRAGVERKPIYLGLRLAE